MRNLLDFLYKYHHWLVFVLLEVVSVVLLFQYNSYQNSVWFTRANAVAGKVYEIESSLTSYLSMAEMNRELTLRNIYQERQLDQLRRLYADVTKDTTEAQRRELDFLNRYQLISAKVVENSILKPFSFGDIIITTPQMYQAVIGIIVLAAFLIILRWTNWGLRLQALSADETLFETLGYNTNRTRIAVFLASGIFIAIASCLTVYDVGLDPNMGMSVLISAIVAMIIGGVGKFSTCIVGGLTLGVLQSLTVYQFASNWQNAVTFLVLLILLFLRPQGIAGYKQRTV